MHVIFEGNFFLIFFFFQYSRAGYTYGEAFEGGDGRVGWKS